MHNEFICSAGVWIESQDTKTVRFIDCGDRTEMKLDLKAAKFDVVECDRFCLDADGVGVAVESDFSEFHIDL